MSRHDHVLPLRTATRTGEVFKCQFPACVFQNLIFLDEILILQLGILMADDADLRYDPVNISVKPFPTKLFNPQGCLGTELAREMWR